MGEKKKVKLVFRSTCASNEARLEKERWRGKRQGIAPWVWAKKAEEKLQGGAQRAGLVHGHRQKQGPAGQCTGDARGEGAGETKTDKEKQPIEGKGMKG